MRYRKLGRTNLEVSEVGYGSWGIGGKQWLGGSDEEAVGALQRAIELGVNFIDTALAYGDGHSEQLVGKVSRSAKSKVFIATKVPPRNRLWPARPLIGIEEVFPRDYVVECTEQSLKNLGVERIDLQQLHVWNPEWVSSEEWRRAFEDLKKSGKAGTVGISINDHQPDSGLEAIETGLIDTVQVIYNIFDPGAEQHLLPLAQKKNIGVIARSPLDEGSLSGAIAENTQFPPGDFRGYYFQGDRRKQVVEKITGLQNELGQKELGLNNAPLPEVALRFCLSHPAVSTVIPGMRTRKNVDANAAVSAKGPLSEKTLQILEKHAWRRNFYGV